jgi:hypothetical protein
MIVDAPTHVWRRWPHEPEVPDPQSRASVGNVSFEMWQ